jgi:peptidoglycan/LPS O-acetylase OafA/YrhL
MGHGVQAARPYRTHSLDTLRAAAILLVFCYHYKVFVSGASTFGWVSDVGWVGVDLFFVLSGYLIGNQLFAGLRADRDVSLRSFYARRALRTWPAYWFVLALYFLFPSTMGGRTPPDLWKFLTFTQNFQLQPGTAFSHAWSLCIEEQFYLVLPLVVLWARRVGSTLRQAWLLMFALCSVGIVARAVLWSSYGREGVGDTQGYYPNIYYATLCRFDEFIPGVAVAFLKHFHERLWTRLTAHSGALFTGAAAAVAAALYGVHSHYVDDAYGYHPFMTIAGYSLIAWAFGLLVVAALSPASPLQRIRVPGAFHLAAWSYSIYLSHKAVAFVLSGRLRALGVGPGFELAVISLASVVVGALLYQFVEQPFLRLRDATVPSLFRAPRMAA